MKFLSQRNRQAEWMDASDVDPVALNHALIFIRRINWLLGYSRATIHHLDRFSRTWKPGQQIRILDIATGSADIPRAILRWADRKGFQIKIVAVDLHEATILTAARMETDPRLKFIRADATQLPFESANFDYVLTGMFLHHLDEQTAVEVLKEMDRVAAVGLIAADLIRSRRAYFWITLFTLFAGPMVRHDARVSVAGAFNRSELIGLCKSAGLTHLRPHHHFAHRLVLAGIKQSPDPSAAWLLQQPRL